jgi:hypothetical protein
MEKLINWSELSRYITGGDRKCIRANYIPKKHLKKLTQLFEVDFPKWWKEINPQK